MVAFHLLFFAHVAGSISWLWHHSLTKCIGPHEWQAYRGRTYSSASRACICGKIDLSHTFVTTGPGWQLHVILFRVL